MNCDSVKFDTVWVAFLSDGSRAFPVCVAPTRQSALDEGRREVGTYDAYFISVKAVPMRKASDDFVTEKLLPAFKALCKHVSHIRYQLSCDHLGPSDMYDMAAAYCAAQQAIQQYESGGVT